MAHTSNSQAASEDPYLRSRGPRLFLRVFLFIVGTVFGTQLLSLSVLLLVREPEPAVYSVDDVAAALISGTTQIEALHVSVGEPPADSANQNRRDGALRAALADVLHRPEADVRVTVSRPPDFLGKKDFNKHASTKEGKSDDARSSTIVGKFQAAVRLPDNRWRIVSSGAGRMDQWQWQALLWLVAPLVVAAPLAWIVARRVATPVKLFSAAAERIGRDPNASPLELKAPFELAPAVLALNEMQKRIKRYVDDRTTLVAAIAHDLRTPLMRLALIVDRAPESIRLAADGEIKEMSERITHALSFVRGVSRPANRQRLNLTSLVESVVNERADGGADVTIGDSEQVVTEGNVPELRALFDNLVDNAIRYAGHARVIVWVKSNKAFIRVDDDGPGVPEDELEKLFAPFYRLETSRSRDTGGAGLGLSSARSIARSHGGDLSLSNRLEGGLSALVELPVAQVS